MLDIKLMQSALKEISEIRKTLQDAKHGVDFNLPRFESLLNLKQYLILRSKDQTKLQEKLFLLSLSSLGSSSAHVAGRVETLYEQISSSLTCSDIPQEEINCLGIKEAIKLASTNSAMLFGGKIKSKLSKQTTAIMVTLPSNASDNDGKLIRELADSGVKAFRINSAHDSAEVWNSMAKVIANINESRDEDSKIKIFVDLAGPKIRTGRIRKVETPVEIGSNKAPQDLLVFYSKDMITKPKTKDAQTQKKEPAQIVIEKEFFQTLKEGEQFKIKDSNKKKVLVNVVKIYDDYAKCEIEKKVYLNNDSKVSMSTQKGKIFGVQKRIEPIRLFKNDLIDITENDTLGRSAIYDENNTLLKPILISGSFSGIIKYIDLGEKIFIDDGKIGLEVIQKNSNSIRCKVFLAKSKGTLLKEEKGINFPSTNVKIKALTKVDKINALSVMGFVDTFNLSFTQNAEDVLDLQNLLKKYERTDIGIVAKIETNRAVVNMPEILEQLLKCEKSGVMIARGDLAIEVGFQKLAYIQEELLDICDAAHMPVIWATQVLESQMKNNLPSRAEITDAAMSSRAECVMLNKGAFAIDTIGVLIHILDDMHSIFKKNRQLLSKKTFW